MKKFTKRLIAGLLAGVTLIVSMPSPERVWADEPVAAEEPVVVENPGTTELQDGLIEPQTKETVPQTEEPASGEVVPEEIIQESGTGVQGSAAEIQIPETEAQATEENAQEPEAVVQEQATGENALEAETEEPENNEEIRLEAQTDGVTVKVNAEPGTFPEKVSLVVQTVGTDEEQEATAAVDEVRDENVNVAASYTFDIKVVDTEGNELQPEEGKNVNISFELAHASDSNLTADVYHIEENESTDEALSAQKLETETNREESSVTAVTDGFSLYTVEFTYNSLQYVLDGGEKILLATILESLGLTGEVENVEVSNEELFSATEEDGEWFITSHKAFNTDEWMKVTINGTEYEIRVTDDPAGVTSWDELQSEIDSAGNGATITLAGNIEARENNVRLLVKKNDASTTITIDLKGFTIDRKLSNQVKDNGHVIDVNKGTLNLVDTSTDHKGTITGGFDKNGGGIVIGGDGKLVAQNITITGNRAEDGGGIYVYKNGNVELNNVAVSGNKSTKYGGGGITNKGTTTLVHCKISNNRATASGGGMYSEGTSDITSTTFDENEAQENGGGIHICGGTSTMTGCELKNNFANALGGGIFVDEKGELNLSDSTEITQNTAYGGSGVVVGGTVRVKDDLQVYDNMGNNVLIYENAYLELNGALTNTSGHKIGVIMSKVTGTFTKKYNDYNPSTDPADLFTVDIDGYSVIKKDGNAVIVESEWPQLQKLINDKAGTGDPIPTLELDRDWTAKDGDVALTVPADKSLIIDLNGHTINRNRASKSENGQVFVLGPRSQLTIKDTSDNPGTITGGWAANGGAFYVDGETSTKLTIESGIISGNKAEKGGAIFMAGAATVDLKGGAIKGNSASNEAGGIWVGSGTLNVSGNPYVHGNAGSAGRNILLDTNKVLNITGNLTNGAKLDLAIKSGESEPDTGTISGAQLTSGLATYSANAQDIFTYNEQPFDDTLQVKNNELYQKDVTADEWVSKWKELQDFVNNSGNKGKTVGLKNDIDASGDDYSIKVDGKKIPSEDGHPSVTIELNGHTMDRRRSSSKSDGHVIVVKNKAWLVIKDSAGTGVITGGNTDDDGGGIKIEKDSKCTIKGGAITGNRSEIDSGWFSDSGGDGGGIYVAGTLEMDGGTVSNNYAEDTAGGIYCADTGTFTIKNATISGNTSENDGGGLIAHLKSDASIENSKIINNTSKTEDGGAMRVENGHTLSITNTEISGNWAENDGGGIVIYDGTVNMTGGSISGNTSEDGAGVYNQDTIVFEGVTIDGNISNKKGGAGINNRESATATLTSCTITGNVGQASGGGIYNKGTLSVSGGKISNNTALNQGGGIYNDSSAIIENCEVSLNIAVAGGGGIYNNDSLTIKGTSKVSSNSNVGETKEGTGISGGGIYNNDSLSIEGNCTIESNSATGDGGGIYSEDDMSLDGCALNYNRAAVSGGGISIKDCKATIGNCTFKGNESYLYGGGIYVGKSAKLELNNGVIKDNSAVIDGGGIYVGKDTNSVKIQGKVEISGNMGYGDVYLAKDKKLEVTGSLAESLIGVGIEEGLGNDEYSRDFTKNYSNYNGDEPDTLFFSDDDYDVVKNENTGEARFKKPEPTEEDPNPFIDIYNNMASDMSKIKGSNWMSYLSGERSLAQVNMPGTHDSGTADVEGNQTTSLVAKITQGVLPTIVTGVLSVLSLGVGLIAGALAGWFSDDIYTAATDRFARCQRRYIDEQLKDGIRRFDLRVNTYYVDDNDRIDDGSGLWIIHGKDVTGTYYAKNHEGKWLKLDEVFKWYKDFLRENPTETIILEIEAQGIDVGDDADERIERYVRELQFEINPSTGKPYLYAEDGNYDNVYKKQYSRWPLVKECRGQIIYNLPKNRGLSEGTYGPDGNYKDGAAKKIKDLTNFYTGKKYAVIKPALFEDLPVEAQNSDFNYYVSAGTNGTDEFRGDTPLSIADKVLPVLFGTNGKKGLIDDTFMGKFFGLVNMDGEYAKISRQVWITNFPNSLEKRTITVVDALDDEKKTYTVLSGTTINIPECVFANPKTGGDGNDHYFLNWNAYNEVEPTAGGSPSGDYNPGATFKVEENVTFTAVRDNTIRNTIHAVWIERQSDTIESVNVIVNRTQSNPGQTVTLYKASEWRTSVDYDVSSIEVDSSDQVLRDYDYIVGGIDGTTIYFVPKKSAKAEGSITWNDNNNAAGKRPSSVKLTLYADGVEKKVVEVTAGSENKWEYDLGDDLDGDPATAGTGLPLFKVVDGKFSRISYTLKETDANGNPIDGYSTAISGLNTEDGKEGFEIINTLESSNPGYCGYVVWADGKPDTPEYVTVSLIHNGTLLDSKEVKMGYWPFALKLDPVQDEEQRNIAEYDVEATAVDGYRYEVTKGKTFEDGFIVTYTLNTHDHDYQTTSAVTKEPTCTEPGEKVTFRFCPKCGNVQIDQGESIPALGHDWDDWKVTRKPTVTEEGVETRVCKRCDLTETRAVPKIETVTVNVTKIWDHNNNPVNNRPNTARFVLYSDGDKLDDAVADATSGWKCSFPYLPKTSDGRKIVYTVMEDSVDNYSASNVRSESGGEINYTFTNKYTPMQRHVNVVKEWDDNNDQDGIRPSSVEIKVYLTDNDPATTDVDTKERINLTAENGWSGGINLYAPDQFNYKLVETPVDGYASTVTGNDNTGFTIVNTHTPAKTVTIKGTKTWVDNTGTGHKPSSITVRLVADGRDVVYQTVKPDTNGAWTYNFGSHPQFNDNGNQIVYTVREDAVQSWTPEYPVPTVDDTNGTVTANITNTYSATNPATTSVSFSVEWRDGEDRDRVRPDEITVKLYKSVNGVRDTVPVSTKPLNQEGVANHNWSGVFSNLPVNDTDTGAPITYTVEEEGPGLTGTDAKGTYKVQYSGDQTKGYTITNTHTPLTVVKSRYVRVRWDDGDNADGLRPTGTTTITATLVGKKATGVEYMRYTHELNAAGDWKHEFKDIIVQDADGNPITYELVLSGDSISGDADTGYKFSRGMSILGIHMGVLTHNPETVTISGTKTWTDNDDEAGKRPESITVHLFNQTDGKEVDFQTVTASKGWNWSFNNVVKNKNGTAITYKVFEDYVPEYVATNEVYNITNTYTAPVDPVTVTYRLDGGKYNGSSDDIVETYNRGTEITAHAQPVKDGFVFVQWKWTDSSSTEHYYQPGDAITLDDNMVLEADWVVDVANRKLIVFNPNGGVFTENGQTTADVKSYYYSEGTRIGIPQAPVREGYTFLYWQGSTYYPGDSYLVLDNHTFTAQWAKNPSPHTPDDDSDDSGDSGGSSSSPSTPAPVTPTVINPYAYYFSNVPGVPDTGNSNGKSNNSSKSGSGFGGPDTGDNSMTWTWLILFVVSAGVIVVMVWPSIMAFHRRKKKN